MADARTPIIEEAWGWYYRLRSCSYVSVPFYLVTSQPSPDTTPHWISRKNNLSDGPIVEYRGRDGNRSAPVGRGPSCISCLTTAVPSSVCATNPYADRICSRGRFGTTESKLRFLSRIQYWKHGIEKERKTTFSLHGQTHVEKVKKRRINLCLINSTIIPPCSVIFIAFWFFYSNENRYYNRDRTGTPW